MPNEIDRANAFCALHEREQVFIIPNPWDVGSARMLATFGFEALATTSAGFSHSCGRREGGITREQALAHARDIVEATELPVSADLENGYGHDPETVAETVRLAAEAGLSGCSIEDATGNPDAPIYGFEEAVRRIEAAAAAARSLPAPFMLTARAENYLFGRPDLEDTIRRLRAFEDAGAGVLYAPGLKTREEVKAVVDALTRPVNVVMGLQGVQLSAAELGDIGVRRISVGSALSRAAYGAFLRAAQEMAKSGTFDFAEDAASFSDIENLLPENS